MKKTLVLIVIMFYSGILNSQNSVNNVKLIHCKLLDSKGEVYGVSKMSRFHICDLLNRPFPIDPVFIPGDIAFIPVNIPFRISLPLEVPGFGEVFCYADNKGKGYTSDELEKSKILFLNHEFAVDRLASIHKILEDCKQSSITISSATVARINEAERLLAKSETYKSNDKLAAKWAMESLRESLWAGEMLVVERAKQLIERRGARPGFLFGCCAFQFKNYESPYAKLYESLFNYATLPFYMGGTQKINGRPDYSRVDTMINALQNTQIISKGHPLIFLTPDGTPAYAKNKEFPEVKQICLDYISQSILRFRGRIHIWDVVNEAHVQPDTEFGDAIIPGYTKEQAIELSCEAAKKAREVDPTCYRIINSTGTWADYYLGRKSNNIWQQNAYDYLQMLEDANCEYEAIGLQYYHSGRDLLEFERDIERFAHFKKPIHITELQIPSSSAEIVGGWSGWWGGGTGGAGMLWHGTEFTETIQADWAESIYTILYSKPYVEAITWWDFSDPGFVSHGGLIKEDMTPKESYFRLKALLDQWKAMK